MALMSRTIHLRSRLVETPAGAIPELGDTPYDNVSAVGSDRAHSPAPEIEAPILRRPSFGMEGQIESDLVSDHVSTLGNKFVIEPRGSQSEPDNRSKKIPRINLSGRGRGGIRMRPNREYSELSGEQIATVAAAEAALTNNEHARVAQRQLSEATSRGEGPSRDKGKGRAFSEALSEPEGEDLELQRAMYRVYKDLAKNKRKEEKKRVQIATGRDVPIVN